MNINLGPARLKPVVARRCHQLGCNLLRADGESLAPVCLYLLDRAQIATGVPLNLANTLAKELNAGQIPSGCPERE